MVFGAIYQYHFFKFKNFYLSLHPNVHLNVSKNLANLSITKISAKKLKNGIYSPSFLLINARSVLIKMFSLSMCAAYYKPYFIEVTESWVSESIPDST